MSADDIVRFTSQAMLVCMLVSAPAILTSALVGVLVAFFQAVTSLQDSSLSHAIKLVAVSAVIGVTAKWTGSQLLGFTQSLYQAAFKS